MVGEFLAETEYCIWRGGLSVQFNCSVFDAFVPGLSGGVDVKFGVEIQDGEAVCAGLDAVGVGPAAVEGLVHKITKGCERM